MMKSSSSTSVDKIKNLFVTIALQSVTKIMTSKILKRNVKI